MMCLSGPSPDSNDISHDGSLNVPSGVSPYRELGEQIADTMLILYRDGFSALVNQGTNSAVVRAHFAQYGAGIATCLSDRLEHMVTPRLLAEAQVDATGYTLGAEWINKTRNLWVILVGEHAVGGECDVALLELKSQFAADSRVILLQHGAFDGLSPHDDPVRWSECMLALGMSEANIEVCKSSQMTLEQLLVSQPGIFFSPSVMV